MRAEALTVCTGLAAGLPCPEAWEAWEAWEAGARPHLAQGLPHLDQSLCSFQGQAPPDHVPPTAALQKCRLTEKE